MEGQDTSKEAVAERTYVDPKRRVPRNWRDVQLKYSDGFIITACLDINTIKRLEQGDNELMERIRRTKESCSIPTGTEQSSSLSEESSVSSVQSSANESTECSQANSVKKSWTADETKQLFHLRSSMEEEFQSHKVHVGLWGKIQESMNKEGIEVTAKQCENKFKSLKRDFKAAVDNNRTSGNSPKSCQFFDEFNELYGLKAGTRPSFTLSSMEESSSSSPENVSRNKKTTKRKRNTEDETLSWLKDYDTRGASLYDIPYDIRCKILHYLSTQDKKSLCSIDRTWRAHITPNLRKATLPCNVSCDFLKSLLNIEEIKIFGSDGSLTKFNCIKEICSLIKGGSFQMLNSFVITGVNLSKEQIITLIDAVKLYVKILDIDAVLKPSVVQMIFQSCAKLKYLSFYPQSKYENGISILVDWVELLDNYYGCICFGHNVLDRIPKRMLTYDRKGYNMPFPIGIIAKATQKDASTST